MMLFESRLSPEDRAFHADVQRFLDEALTPDIIAAEDAQRSMVADYARGSAWIERLRPRRWHAAHWPREHGGAGLTPLQNYLLLYEMGLRGAPHLPPMGLNYVGPTLVRFGSPEQQARLLPRILSGEDYWCQGFSEPGSGSDLASVATFAERRGDAYVVNGQKIWTTDAHHANKIFCLVRTRREQAYDALSFLLLDMDAPGVSVRPIRLFSGDHDFNQVFFDAVEVPVENLLGDEGNGWEVARYLLEIERGAFVFGGRLRRRLQRLLARARTTPNVTADFWQRAARLDCDLLAYECTELRLGHISATRDDGAAAANQIKIEWTELLQKIDALGVDISGAETLYADAAAHGASTRCEGTPMPDWLAGYFNNLAATIYGGSNEIQRNLVYRAMKRTL